MRDIFLQYFKYNPSLPSCLESITNRKCTIIIVDNAPINMAGYLAVQKNGRNVWKTKIKGKMYNISRIVYTLENGEIPKGYVVDHIDGDETNNKKHNLRAVPQAINGRNVKKSVKNLSGITGVRFFRNQAGNEYFSAFWMNLDGKLCSKYFSVSKYGYDGARTLAEELRIEMIDHLNSIGAGYSERHGTDG